MRKLVIAAAAVAALAWARSVPADHHMKSQTSQEGARQSTSPHHPGTDSASASAEARAARDDAAKGGERKGAFEGKSNFDLDGRVSQASSGELTIERKDLPPAKLKVGPTTKIEVDGERASAAQLKPGQEVKASFNLRGATAEAVEIKARKAKDDDSRKLQEQRQETRKDANERRQQR